MNWRKLLYSRKTFWIVLGLVSILLSTLMPPSFVEQYYSRGLFLLIRKCFSVITGWLPFAAVYLLFLLLVYWMIRWGKQLKRTSKPLGSKILQFLSSLLAFAGGVIFSFQLLWGFNYGRIPLEEQMQLTVKPLDVHALKRELTNAINGINTYRPLLENAGDSSLLTVYAPTNLEATMRQLLIQVLEREGYPIPAEVRGRALYPKGLLLRISTAGVYIPFTGEGHVDPGLHHLQKPFVLAHEMSHAYGIGGEGDCNFLAYLACLESEDPYLNYVGHLYYFRYVAPDFRAYKPEAYKAIWETIPLGVKNDLRAIRTEMNKYPDIMPAVRDAAYNTYLKAQGIDDGIKNYDRVTMLVHAWHKKTIIQ